MKLNYIEIPVNNGGGAVPGCGTIYCSEIAATLDQLTNDLSIIVPENLNEYILGSTGKRIFESTVR